MRITSFPAIVKLMETPGHEHLDGYSNTELRDFFEQMKYVPFNPNIEAILKLDANYLPQVKEMEELAVQYFSTVIDTNRERESVGNGEDYSPEQYELKSKAQGSKHDAFILSLRNLLKGLNSEGHSDLTVFAKDWYPVNQVPNRAPIALFALDMARRVFIREIKSAFDEKLKGEESIEEAKATFIDLCIILLRNPRDEEVQRGALLLAKQINPDKKMEELFWELTSDIY